MPKIARWRTQRRVSSAFAFFFMKRTAGNQPLFKLSVRINGEAEDAVVELFSRVFDMPASVYSDTEKKATTVTMHREGFSATERAAIRDGLRAIAAAGLDVGMGKISVTSVRRENWAESWKRHFHPLEISSRLLVLPSWSKQKPKRGQALVVLDPGLSFGTGHHPTTAFCLKQIAVLRKPGTSQSMLDAGCGSGILSIAAAKLGYEPIVAFDFDPDAVRVAKENAKVNRVDFNISQQDLTQLPVRSSQSFDLVCANLIYDILIEERRKVAARVAPSGTLVLAGILREQFPKVARAYEEIGLCLVKAQSLKEWHSGIFRRDPKTH
jgi:ribosomal protein L11 methyltransferase